MNSRLTLHNYSFKVDAKTTDEGLSAFMVSCLMGDVQIAELLLARGASIHSTAMESKMMDTSRRKSINFENNFDSLFFILIS